MVKEFPKGKEWLLDNSALRVSLDMTFDVPGVLISLKLANMIPHAGG